MTIEGRLRRLERQNRALALALFGAIVVALGVAASGPGDKVRARSYSVVDDAGVVRAAFGLNRFGEPSIALGEGPDDVRASLTYGKDGATLRLRGKEFSNQASLSIGPDGRASLSLRDGTRVGMSAGPDGAGILIADPADTTRANILMDAGGNVSRKP